MSEDWEPCCGGEHYFVEHLGDDANTTVSHPAVIALTQDALDGAALRRLREALPDGWATSFEYYGQQCRVWAFSLIGGMADVRAFGSGATIAEAADKCREALSGQARLPK